MSEPVSLILVRGGGDLATGVALRLYRAGIKILMTEQPQPSAVRRLVSFAEAVFRGRMTVEGVTATLAHSLEDAPAILRANQIPLLIDPDCKSLSEAFFARHFRLIALVDARMIKRPPEFGVELAPFVIGLGPGFVAGENCHAAIETNRGHFLGRVLWQGAPEADTGIPGAVARQQAERVLRAPAEGIFNPQVELGSPVKKGQIIGEVMGQALIAPFDGVLRGLIHGSLLVTRGMKIGDLDPRNDLRFASLVSEKSLAIAGGVLEALLTRPQIRTQLWI